MLNRWAIQLTPDERRFWNRWVVFTGLAFICFALPLAPTLSLGLAGLLIGVLQWLILRHEVTWAIHWIWTTTAGAFSVFFIVTVLLGDLETTTLPPTLYLALNYLILGATIGFAQWLVLQRHIHRAGWWALASAASYAFSFIVLGSFLSLVESIVSLPVSILIRLVFFVVMGLLVGALTGAVMIWLLRHPYPTR